MAWSPRPEPRCRLAIGSCLEHESNRIQVVELNEDSRSFVPIAEVEHSFPATKLMWAPYGGKLDSRTEVLASAGTTLNLFRLEEDGQMKMTARLANNRRQQEANLRQNGLGHFAPLTSFDWNVDSPQCIGTSSVDTTCTIWNIERQKIETQLIAHDKAVYDLNFSQKFLFASCGADGSVRLFDQRNLEHSTIIYETNPVVPLLRLAWNKINRNYIATVAMDSSGVTLIDIRRPSVALATLSQLDACVNSVVWAPHSRNHLLCGTQDGQALIWDVKEVSTPADGTDQSRPRPPSLFVHGAGQEVYQVHWSSTQPDWVALGSAKQVEVLQI
uniref:Peroxin-7 n=1 Tax=Alexandrium catenella TaxID=2925 RepID=A0A7S1QJS0_ALECA